MVAILSRRQWSKKLAFACVNIYIYIYIRNAHKTYTCTDGEYYQKRFNLIFILVSYFPDYGFMRSIKRHSFNCICFLLYLCMKGEIQVDKTGRCTALTGGDKLDAQYRNGCLINCNANVWGFANVNFKADVQYIYRYSTKWKRWHIEKHYLLEIHYSVIKLFFIRSKCACFIHYRLME